MTMNMPHISIRGCNCVLASTEAYNEEFANSKDKLYKGVYVGISNIGGPMILAMKQKTKCWPLKT